VSIHTAGTHTRRDDATAHLRFAYEFITHADLEGRLGNPSLDPNPDSTSPSPARGRPRQYMPYTATALACVMYELVASSRPYTVKEMVDALWHRYTDGQLRLIGLGGLRDTARRAQMRVGSGATPTQKQSAAAIERAEYERAHKALSTLLAAMDDTPLIANHTKDSRPTRKVVADAWSNPGLKTKTETKNGVVNALIGSALHVQNAHLNPGTSLHGPGGILEDHEGHLAFDETHIATAAWNVPGNIAPGNYMARVHAHSKIYKGAPSLIGITAGVTIARPTQPHDVPTLCLGAKLHHPTGGLGSAVIEILDAIDTNDLRAPQRSNINQQLVFDPGYTESVGLNRGAANRRYGIVIKYKKDQRTLHQIQAVRHEDGTVTPGIWLFNGVPVCPGVSKPVLSRMRLSVPEVTERRKRSHDDDQDSVHDEYADELRDEGSPEEYYSGEPHSDAWDEGTDDRKNPTKRRTANPLSGPQLLARDRKLASVLPFVMATSGRPREVADNKRGGQSKSAPDRDPVMRVTLICPKIKGTARCELFDDYMDDDLRHLPAVPAPPVDLPIDQAPACCSNPRGTMQLRIPMDEFKDWQDFMPGTWEHFDWYSGPRSANERYNARIKHTVGGSNLNRNSIAVRKASTYTLFTAMAIVNANRQTVETWHRDLDRNAARIDKLPGAKKPSPKPTPAAHANRARRRQILDKYLAGLSRGRRDHDRTDPTAAEDDDQGHADEPRFDETPSDSES
jgi:hypothetical protein